MRKIYRFKITSKQNQSVLGTGSFTSSEELNAKQQLDFFHQYMNGKYLKSEDFVTIEIFEVNHLEVGI